MRATIRQLLHEDGGEDLIEYALLAAFAASIALVAVTSDPLGIKPALVRAFRQAKDALTNA